MRKTWKAVVAANYGIGTWYSEGLALGDGIGLWVALNITTASGFTLDVSVELFDPVAGWVAAEGTWAFAQKSTSGADQLWIHPHMTAAANNIIASGVPALVRIKAVVGTAICNFSVGVSELL